MKNLFIAAIFALAALSVTACSGITVQGVSERVIATKEIASVTINAICKRPEDDVIRVDIRNALKKVGNGVDSRKICTEGLDVYLTEVVNSRLQGPATTTTITTYR